MTKGRAPDSRPPSRRIRPARVLIVEDERLLAELLAEVVADEEDMQVVGVAATVAEAIALARLRPDVVLMDYRLPDGTGAQATRAIKARSAHSRVVMLSALHDDETLLESIQAGADGYLTKGRAVEDIVAAVRAARSGEMLLPTSVIVSIAQRVAAARARGETRPHIVPLTDRQLQILRGFASGLSTLEIAEQLSVKPNTVRTHVDHILRKLGVHSKLEAVAFALRHRLIEPPREDQPGR